MTSLTPYSDTLFKGQTFKERKRDMTIETSRAAAIAAFRAGRVAGHREALGILVQMIEPGGSFEANAAIMNACEAISRLSKDYPANDRNLPRDPEAEEAAEKETAE